MKETPNSLIQFLHFIRIFGVPFTSHDFLIKRGSIYHLVTIYFRKRVNTDEGELYRKEWVLRNSFRTGGANGITVLPSRPGLIHDKFCDC